MGVLVATPAECSEAVLEVGVGADDVVVGQVHQQPGTSSGSRGCSGIGWLFLLERFSGWVADETSDAFFVKYPNTGHGNNNIGENLESKVSLRLIIQADSEMGKVVYMASTG